MTQASAVPSIDTEELKVEPRAEGGLSLRFAGSADTRSLAALEALLASFHAEAIRLETSEVTVDFRALHFINSSCLKAFVVWLGRVQELEREKQYRILFFADDAKPWQRRSLGTLGCFAVDLVRIETKGAVV